MNHALQNEEPVELWHVEVAPNDVRVVTLEQLDEAFQRGLVNERTRVFQDGMDEPAYLGELLGLGDAEEEEEEAPHHAAPAPSSRIHQNTLVGLAEPEPVRHRAPPPQAVTRSAPPPQAASARSAPPPQAAPRNAPPPMSAETYRAVTVSQRPRAAAPASAWPPVVQAPATRTAPPPPVSVVAPSVVPLAMDLGDDLDDFPKPKRTGKILFLAVGALAVAAGVGLAVTGQGASMLSSLTASASPAPAAVKPAAPVEAPKSHAYDPGDAPVKLKEAPPPLVLTTRENEASVLGSTPTTPSTPDTTAKAGSTIGSKLAAAKAAVTKAFSGKRAKSGGGGASKAPATAGHAFKSGGGKSAIYDPLNGSL